MAVDMQLDAEAVAGSPRCQWAGAGARRRRVRRARSIWNGLIDRRPALIVQCSGAADVVDAVNFAREQGLVLSVKGGGHNVAGNAVNDGGLVIDLSQMNGVHVDPATRGPCALQGGAHLGRLRPRDAALRARRARRRRLDDGHRRPDAARRRRPPAPQVRALDRQPAVGRHRHRGRAAPPGERDRERGPVLGGARRRQQLRRRDLVRVPRRTRSARWCGRRGHLSARTRGKAVAAGLARLHGRRPGRAELARDLLAASRRAEPFPPELHGTPVVAVAGVVRAGRSRRASRSCSRCASSASRSSTLSGPVAVARAPERLRRAASRRAGSTTGSRGRSPS